jgi:hypothetical protein
MKKQDTKTSPPVKVVGFRVEGATPSPRDSALADAADAINTLTGSPSPVIIPPAFTVRSCRLQFGPRPTAFIGRVHCCFLLRARLPSVD